MTCFASCAFLSRCCGHELLRSWTSSFQHFRFADPAAGPSSSASSAPPLLIISPRRLRRTFWVGRLCRGLRVLHRSPGLAQGGPWRLGSLGVKTEQSLLRLFPLLGDHALPGNWFTAPGWLLIPLVLVGSYEK